MNQSHSLNLKMTAPANVPVMCPRTVSVAENNADPSSPEAKAADRLMISCRENVRFLNNHLQAYSRYLDLPPLVDNTLYLAYTIRVKDNVPFDPNGLQRWLVEAGIETNSAFHFSDHAAKEREDDRTFCLGCHQYLTIPDLVHVAETFDLFFGLVARSKTASAGKDR